jgi:hypothetical protein
LGFPPTQDKIRTTLGQVKDNVKSRERRAEEVRPIVREAIEASTVREVEAVTGISRTTLHDFAFGGKVPQEKNLAVLEEWARQQGGREPAVGHDLAPAPVPAAAAVYERIDAILALPTPPGILVLLMDALGTAVRAEAEREAQVAAQERAKAMRAAEEAARIRAGAMEPEEERGWFVERLSDELRDRIRRELETPPQTGGAAGRDVA